MTKFPALFAALCEPWPDREVRTLSKGGRSFGYVRADQVMTRLDEVLGPEGWYDRYQRDPGGSDAVLCLLTIRLPDGSELTKCDLGAPADMPDEGDAEKSAVSDALKRAAVKFGVGRWLRGPVPDFGPAPAAREGLPSQARPEHPPEAEPMRPAPGPGRGRAPTSGGALWRWCKDHDERDDAGLVEHLTRWAKHERFPAKMVQWTPEQVSRGYAEAVQQLQATAPAAAGSGVPR